MPKYADLSHSSTIAMNRIERGSESATFLNSPSASCGSWSMLSRRRLLDSKGVELVAIARSGALLASAIHHNSRVSSQGRRETGWRELHSALCPALAD
jgi:hypothetical protein